MTFHPRSIIVILALVLDHLLGDPSNRWHPVAWMGHGIAWAMGHAPGQDASRSRQMAYGGGIILVGMSTLAGIGAVLARMTRELGKIGWVLEALILQTTLARRGLSRAARQVQTALEDKDWPAARHWLSWHLVSRDTSELQSWQIVAATIESVAENLSDGVFAPLFWYLVGGLPVALVYRFLNTADAMLGYRDPARAWLGKIPARADDLVNLIPARVTAWLLLLATPLAGGDIIRAWRVWHQDARQTASPNAGHPMSVMAGALGVRLEKTNAYVLGRDLRSPQAHDITRALRLMTLATGLFILFSVGYGKIASTRLHRYPSFFSVSSVSPWWKTFLSGRQQ